MDDSFFITGDQNSDYMFEFTLYLLGCFLFLIFAEKYRRTTFAITVIIAMIYPLVAEISEFSNFIQIKYYSILIPAILFSFSKCKPHSTSESFEKVFAIMPGILRLALALNIAEAVVYVFLFDKFVTAFFGLVLMFTIPKFSYDENQDIGFEDLLWTISYSMCLMIGLLFHPLESPLTSSGIAILAIALLSCVYVQKWKKWISFRVYSLYYLIILDALFSRNGFSIYDWFYSKSFSPENRITPLSENLFRIVSIGLCMILLYRWWKVRNPPSPRSSVNFS